MSENKASVSFSCQRCLQPLKLDSSLNNLGEHTIADLSLPITRNVEEDLEFQSCSLDHYVPPFRLSDSGNGTNGFLVISDGWETTSLGQQIQVKAKLFDWLSNNSDVDHPLCDECTDFLLETMQKQLEQTESEWKDYSQYYNKLENEKDDLDLTSLRKELLDWNQEQSRLMEELQSLQKEEKSLKDEITNQELEKERLLKEQTVYWKNYNKHIKEIMVVEDEEKLCESQIAYLNNQVEKLKKTNIFKIVFHISESNDIATINHLRLGRLPGTPVDWSEINAAWGQTTLLLNSLARKCNFKFERYKLVPFGSHSYIETLQDGKVLTLYGTGGFKFLWDSKFDLAMVAFLDCMQQFKEHLDKAGFRLPYKLDKGKIDDYSIKIQFNSEELWTKALKYMLTNLKWALTWISGQFNEE